LDFIRSAQLYFRNKGDQSLLVNMGLSLAFVIRSIIYFFSGNLHRVTDSLKLAGKSLAKT